MNELVFNDSIETIDVNKWMDFLEVHPRRNAFQSFEMFNFWNSLIDYRPFILVAINTRGECIGFCTGVVAPTGKSRTKYHDKTALIYGGPLLIDDGEEIREQFIRKLTKLLRSISRITEFRNLGCDLYLKESFTGLNWDYTPKLNYLIKLDSEEEVFARFSKSKRRQIRKTIGKGIETSDVKSEENIRSIFEILNEIFKKNDKTLVLPIPDLNFFRQLMKLDFTGLIVVRLNEKVIGGGFFIYDETYLYHWFRGGKNKEYASLNPDSVIDWCTMKFGLKKKIKYLDFMGAGRKGWENRIRTYKSRFGGELVENGMYSKASYPFLFRVQNKIKSLRN